MRLSLSAPSGSPQKRPATLSGLPGVDPDCCLPIVAEQPRLLEDLTGSAQRASIIRQDNVVIVGLDPRRALVGRRPLLELDWVEGSAIEAVSLLEKGRACVVPDHFLRETGLRKGDSFAMVPPEDPDHPVHYLIAGAVRLPGWHWQTKQTGLRTRTHRAAALVFADFPSVSRDFDLPLASHVWLRYGPDAVDKDRLAATARSLVERGGPASAGPPEARILPVEDIRRMVQASAKKWIWVIAQLPMIGLMISYIGVLNIILASIRARRWSMGVLRAVGFTRWTLVRLVLAEGLLIGVVADVLSLGFGILAGWCGSVLAQSISFFGGMNPPLVIPWPPIVSGLAIALALSTVAALWPALSIGRAEPMALLQRGRGAQ